MSNKINDYNVIEKIGSGSYGVIYKVVKKSEKLIKVMKQINSSKMSKSEYENSKKEAKLLSSLDSKYIVKYYDSFSTTNHLYIVMEYCEGGDLYKYLSKNYSKNKLLEEDKIWKFFIQLCMGLYYLHSKNILHRDLKTLNIFLTKEGSLKIGDLGVAKILNSDSFANTLVGTPYYLSPEMCEEKPYNEKSDIWALGCILYELAALKHPFYGKNHGALILNIVKGKFEAIPSCYSTNLSKLVDKLLDKNHFKRPSIKEIVDNKIIKSYSAKFNIKLTNDNIAIDQKITNNPNNHINNNLNEFEEVKHPKHKSTSEKKVTNPFNKDIRDINIINNQKDISSNQVIKLNQIENKLDKPEFKKHKEISAYTPYIPFTPIPIANKNPLPNQNYNPVSNQTPYLPKPSLIPKSEPKNQRVRVHPKHGKNELKTYKPKTEIQQENNYMNYNIDAMMSKMNEFDKNIENEQKRKNIEDIRKQNIVNKNKQPIPITTQSVICEIGKTNYFLKDQNDASVFMKNLIPSDDYEKIGKIIPQNQLDMINIVYPSNTDNDNGLIDINKINTSIINTRNLHDMNDKVSIKDIKMSDINKDDIKIINANQKEVYIINDVINKKDHDNEDDNVNVIDNMNMNSMNNKNNNMIDMINVPYYIKDENEKKIEEDYFDQLLQSDYSNKKDIKDDIIYDSDEEDEIINNDNNVDNQNIDNEINEDKIYPTKQLEKDTYLEDINDDYKLPDPNLSDTLEMDSDEDIENNIKDNKNEYQENKVNKENNIFEHNFEPILNSNSELQENKKQYIINYNILKLQLEKLIGEELFNKINIFYQELSNSKAYTSEDSEKFDGYIKKLIPKNDIYNKFLELFYQFISHGVQVEYIEQEINKNLLFKNKKY